MTRKKVSIYISAIVICALAIGIGYYNTAVYFRKAYSSKIWRNNSVIHEEEVLKDFVDNKLTDEDSGIRTNYINEESDGDITKGHTVLSESEGVMLLYYLERDDRKNFDITLDYINKHMMLDNNLLSWRVDGNEKNKASSTIDDLRVTKALLLAQEKWGDFNYRKLAVKISKAIYNESIDNSIVTDLNDSYNKSETTTLCYLDLPTLRMLSNMDYSKWKKVYDNSLEIIDNGYISDDIPLYKKTFYRTENTYDSDEKIETLLSMIVILNKLEENQDVSKSVEWIRGQFQQKGAIVAYYSSENGEPLSDIESTSIYSLIVQISSMIGDKEIYDFAMNKLKGFQVKNTESPIYGGYGAEDGSSVFSYDNLNALMAYRNRIE